jgi:hypothetical protein
VRRVAQQSFGNWMRYTIRGRFPHTFLDHKMTATTQKLQKDTRLNYLCGRHADKFAGSRSVHPYRLWLLGQISAALYRKKPTKLLLDRGRQANIIYRYLHGRSWVYWTPLHQAVSMLNIPAQRGLHERGRGRKTLRRMCRKAVARGIHCRIVRDCGERQRLTHLAAEHERHHPDVRYRREHPNTSDLDEGGLWLAAYADDQRPLVLSVTLLAGDTAALRFFLTLESTQEATLGRYLLTTYLVDELAERRTRHLVDTRNPISIPSGLHHFALMVGFEVTRASLKCVPPTVGERPLLNLSGNGCR